ncbi:TetR/AcrR family transcriptional regulator [Actinophytocola glycyrrhizae]|uniref:TetR/AcrR family transcriptional regulator n=1 Tax=Actinophytocola glycyrrhizae TaxID=2044873 RepID=A0ABV9S7P1_9PSEU
MDTRERIVEAAAALLTEGGREAVSTRAVSTAAGVQAPTIYRLFGDKQGLLDAVAAHGFQSYLDQKTGLTLTDDPVGDLRTGWDTHVGFGLANPALYALIYGEPRPGRPNPAATEATAILAKLVRRVAAAGRLRVGEERAAQVVHAAGCGTTLTLIAQPPDRRDLTVSTLARDAVLAAVTTDDPVTAPGPGPAAVALRAALPGTSALTAHERALLTEWLDRIAD